MDTIVEEAPFEMTPEDLEREIREKEEQNLQQVISYDCVRPLVLPQRTCQGKIVDIKTNFGSLLASFVTGQIEGYEYNRGQGGILDAPEKHVKETLYDIRDNFKPMFFGLVVLCTHPSDPLKFTIAEGHQRIKGLLLRAKAGKMTQDEAETSLIVRVGDSTDHLILYVKENQKKAHTPAERVLNEDLALGSLLRQTFQYCKNKDLIKKSLKPKVCYNISYAIYELQQNNEVRDYWEVFGGAKKWVKQQTMIAKDQAPDNIKKEVFQKIAEAFDFWMEWRSILDDERSKTQKDIARYIKKLMCSASLCGVMLLDYLKQNPRLIGAKRNPKSFANKCIKESVWLSMKTAHLTGGSKQNMEMNYNEILKRITR